MHLVAGSAREYVATIATCGSRNGTVAGVSVEVFCMGLPNTQQTVVVSEGGAGCPRVSAVVSPGDSHPCDIYWVQWRRDPIVPAGGEQPRFWVSGPDGVWAWPGHAATVPSRPIVLAGPIVGALEWTIYPMTPACAPFVIRSNLLPDCVPTSPLVWDWSSKAPIWLLVTWVVGFGVYMLGIVTQSWVRFPRISVMYQSVLLAVHLPLLAHVPFAWYVTASSVAVCIPLSYLAVNGLATLARSPKTFRLATAREWEGFGQLCAFLSFQAMIVGFAIDLER